MPLLLQLRGNRPRPVLGPWPAVLACPRLRPVRACHASDIVGAGPAGHVGGVSGPCPLAGTQISVSSWTYGNGSGNAGLTVSKLIEAMVALDAAEGDENEERYLAIKAKQKGNLLATTEATLKEYGVAKDDLAPLRDGKVAMIVGFETIHSERLLATSDPYDRIPAWRKSAMGLGIAKDISGRMAERPDKRFSMYVYTDMSIGASRLEEAKLVEIPCN